MTRIAFRVLLVAIVAAMALLGLGDPPGSLNEASASHVIDSVDLVAMDADIDDNGDTVPDNDDSMVGTIQPCVEIGVGQTIDVDLVITGVRFDTKVAGYQIDIDYDGTIITPSAVVDVDARGSNAPNDVTIISRINSTGAPGFIPLSDLATTTDSMTVAAVDGTNDAFAHVGGVQGVPQMHEPSAAGNGIDDDFDGDTDDAEETSGDGVLARITIDGTAAGVSPLTIPSTIGGADFSVDTTVVDGSGSDGTPGEAVMIHTLQSALVAVDTACPNPPDCPDAGPFAASEDSAGNTITLPGCTDPDAGQTVTCALDTPPASGSASVTDCTSASYTPGPDFCGTDSFTYEGTDDDPLFPASDSGTVSIDVTCSPDPPTCSSPTVAVTEDIPYGFTTPICTDVDPGDTLTCSLVGAPVGGAVTSIGGCLPTFTPAANLCGVGAGSFQHEATDGLFPPASGTATLDITCVNDAPVCPTVPLLIADEDSINNPVTLPGCSDPVEGGVVACALDTDGANGSASVTDCVSASYTPNPDFCGSDSFLYRGTDDGSPPASTYNSVNFTVNCVPDAPDCPDAGPLTVDEDSGENPLALPGCGDADIGQNVSCALEADAGNGAATVTDCLSVSYAPDPDFCGGDSFTYTGTDDDIPPLFDSGTVSITVNCINDSPACPDVGPVIVDEDSGSNPIALPGCTDPVEGSAVTCALDTSPGDGSASLSDCTSATYTPLFNFCGSDSFTYLGTDTDPSPLSDSGTVSVTVNCLPEDADDDGVADMFDACPAIQEDMDGYQDADGCPESDNDLDGICDAGQTSIACIGSDVGRFIWTLPLPATQDCRNVGEDYDAFHDTDGCPEPDNDYDGFPDGTDDCPATDLTAGPDGIADTGDEPLDQFGVPIQTKEDFDGVIDTDGCHDSPTDDYDGDGLTDEDEAFLMFTNPVDTDTDDDGIEDGVDGLTMRGDQGTFGSTYFVDAPGGTSYGRIVSSGGGGNVVTVRDAPDPQGVRIRVAGPGGPAEIDACGIVRLIAPSASDTTVTCGSAQVRVLHGSITVEFGTIEANVPPGVTLTVEEVSPGSYDVSNSSASPSAVSVGGLNLAPGETVSGISDGDADGWVSAVDYCPAVATVWRVPQGDDDCDGWTTADESLIGTSTVLACGVNAWAPDFDDNGVINIADVFNVLPPYFGSSPPSANYSARRDLAPDGVINISDLFKVLPPYFGLSCAP